MVELSLSDVTSLQTCPAGYQIYSHTVSFFRALPHVRRRTLALIYANLFCIVSYILPTRYSVLLRVTGVSLYLAKGFVVIADAAYYNVNFISTWIPDTPRHVARRFVESGTAWDYEPVFSGCQRFTPNVLTGHETSVRRGIANMPSNNLMRPSAPDTTLDECAKYCCLQHPCLINP